MIRINLIPAEEAQRSAGRRQQVAIGLLAAAGTVLTLVIAHGWQQVSILSANREQARLERQLAELKGPYDQVVAMERQKKELQEKLTVIRDLEAKKFGPVRMLADLSDATPDKLWLTEFNERGGNIKLAGLGVDEQTVADFMRRLSTSPYFRNVDLEETSEAKNETVRHKRFVIKAQVNYAAAARGKGEHAAAKDQRASAPVAETIAKAEVGGGR